MNRYTAEIPEEVIRKGGTVQSRIGSAIAATADQAGVCRVLEAGCGPKWDIDVPGCELRITGLDLDKAALKRRLNEVGDLSEWIVGDLRTVELPAGQFDAVYCSYVLEHVPDAESVLDRLVASLRPGGCLIIRIPDGDSVYGWAARHSPFRMQVAFKKYVERQPNAGKPGHAPYPVVYDRVVSLRGMREYARSRGLRTDLEVGINTYLRGIFGRSAPVVQWGVDAASAVSRGRVAATHNNLVLIYTVV